MDGDLFGGRGRGGLVIRKFEFNFGLGWFFHDAFGLCELIPEESLG